jgi:hypothetical protein
MNGVRSSISSRESAEAALKKNAERGGLCGHVTAERQEPGLERASESGQQVSKEVDVVNVEGRRSAVLLRSDASIKSRSREAEKWLAKT